MYYRAPADDLRDTETIADNPEAERSRTPPPPASDAPLSFPLPSPSHPSSDSLQKEQLASRTHKSPDSPSPTSAEEPAQPPKPKQVDKAANLLAAASEPFGALSFGGID